MENNNLATQALEGQINKMENQLDKMSRAMTLEEIKNTVPQVEILELPPFIQGCNPITIEVRKLDIEKFVEDGNVPNPLIPRINGLFEDVNKKTVMDINADEEYREIIESMFRKSFINQDIYEAFKDQWKFSQKWLVVTYAFSGVEKLKN